MGEQVKALVALLFAGCALDVPAVGAIACELNSQPGETEAEPDACKMVWTEAGTLSRDRDVCESGARCLVLRPGERAFKWHRVGAPPADFWKRIDPTCTVTCEDS